MAKAAQFDETFVGQKPVQAPSKALLNVGEELRASSLSLNKRSMVLDEDKFEEQFLRCGICKERFVNESLPRLLPCHHSFCHNCVIHLYEAAKEHRQMLQSSARSLSTSLSTVSISCPACRSNFLASEEIIKKLPTDHRVVQLMDFLHHTERFTITFCSKHNLQPLNFFCEPCIRPVCRDCTVLDHKDGEGHLVMDLEEALAKYTPVLDSAIIEMDAESVSLEEKRIALESVTQTIEKNKVELIHNVRASMAKLRALIDERERVLEAKVYKEIEKEKEQLTQKSEALIARKKVIEVQTGRLKQAKEERNVEDMFHIHQEVCEYKSAPHLRIQEVDDGIMSSFILSTRDEPLLTSRINSFADIISKVEATASRTKSTFKSYLRSHSAIK